MDNVGQMINISEKDIIEYEWCIVHDVYAQCNICDVSSDTYSYIFYCRADLVKRSKEHLDICYKCATTKYKDAFFKVYLLGNVG